MYVDKVVWVIREECKARILCQDTLIARIRGETIVITSRRAQGRESITHDIQCDDCTEDTGDVNCISNDIDGPPFFGDLLLKWVFFAA